MALTGAHTSVKAANAKQIDTVRQMPGKMYYYYYYYRTSVIYVAWAK